MSFILESLTRAFKGLISPPSEPPGEIMSFGVSPVNYSDSDSYLTSGFAHHYQLDESTFSLFHESNKKRALKLHSKHYFMTWNSFNDVINENQIKSLIKF